MTQEELQQYEESYGDIPTYRTLLDYIKWLQSERNSWYKALSVSSVVMRQKEVIEHYHKALEDIVEFDSEFIDVTRIARQALKYKE